MKNNIIEIDTALNQTAYPQWFTDSAVMTRKVETLTKQIGVDVVNDIIKEGNLTIPVALKITAMAAEIIGLLKAHREID